MSPELNKDMMCSVSYTLRYTVCDTRDSGVYCSYKKQGKPAGNEASYIYYKVVIVEYMFHKAWINKHAMN